MPIDYEYCARCGFDHEYEYEAAQNAHMNCKLCTVELESGNIGGGDDHDCQDHQKED